MLIGCVIFLVFLGAMFGYGAPMIPIAIVTGIFLLFLFFFRCHIIIPSGGYQSYLIRSTVSIALLYISGSVIGGLWVGYLLHYFNVRIVFGG